MLEKGDQHVKDNTYNDYFCDNRNILRKMES